MQLLGRYRYAVLAMVAVGLLLARRDVIGDWRFFELGAGELRGPDPLGLYVRHPEIQVGPPGLLIALVLSHLSAGTLVAKVLGFAAGVGCIRAAELVAADRRTATDRRVTTDHGLATDHGGAAAPQRTLLSGLLFLPLWAFVVNSGHLDDTLAILGVIAAMVAITRNRTLATGVLLGLAVATKPWAILALPVLLGLPAGRRLRPVLVAGLAAVLIWAPFVIGAPGTISALGSFRFPLNGSSGPALLLGLHAGAPYPDWIRPLQFAVGLSAATLIARRGAWWAVPAVAFGVRLLLDPGTITYYAGGLGAGGLVVDLVSAGSMPMLSLATAAGIALPTYLQLALLNLDKVSESLKFSRRAALLRLATTAAVLALVALTRSPEPDPTRDQAQLFS